MNNMLNTQGIFLDVVLSKYKKLDLLMYNYSDLTRNWVLKVSNDGNILDGIITHSSRIRFATTQGNMNSSCYQQRKEENIIASEAYHFVVYLMKKLMIAYI